MYRMERDTQNNQGANTIKCDSRLQPRSRQKTKYEYRTSLKKCKQMKMINRPQNVERKKGENLYLEYKVEQLTKKIKTRIISDTQSQKNIICGKTETKLVKNKSEMKYTNEYSIRRTGKVQVKQLDLNRMRKIKVSENKN